MQTFDSYRIFRRWFKLRLLKKGKEKKKHKSSLTSVSSHVYRTSSHPWRHSSLELNCAHWSSVREEFFKATISTCQHLCWEKNVQEIDNDKVCLSVCRSICLIRMHWEKKVKEKTDEIRRHLFFSPSSSSSSSSVNISNDNWLEEWSHQTSNEHTLLIICHRSFFTPTDNEKKNEKKRWSITNLWHDSSSKSSSSVSIGSSSSSASSGEGVRCSPERFE